MNVMRGEMSLIGPRPELVDLVSGTPTGSRRVPRRASRA